MFVKGLVRYGWVPLIGILLIAWLLEWAPWQKLLALGIAGALVILLSPVLFGVAVALESRRRHQRAEPPKDPPKD